MEKKHRLIFNIIIETLVTIGMLIEGNYWAASGWGFLMLTNVGTLLEDMSKENKNKEN